MTARIIAVSYIGWSPNPSSLACVFDVCVRFGEKLVTNRCGNRFVQGVARDIHPYSPGCSKPMVTRYTLCGKSDVAQKIIFNLDEHAAKKSLQSIVFI